MNSYAYMKFAQIFFHTFLAVVENVDIIKATVCKTCVLLIGSKSQLIETGGELIEELSICTRTSDPVQEEIDRTGPSDDGLSRSESLPRAHQLQELHSDTVYACIFDTAVSAGSDLSDFVLSL